MDNPYSVVPSPSYAAPLNNLFGPQPQQQGQQQNGQTGVAQQSGDVAGQGLAALLKKIFSQGQQPQQPPGAPMNIQSPAQQASAQAPQMPYNPNSTTGSPY